MSAMILALLIAVYPTFSLAKTADSREPYSGVGVYKTSFSYKGEVYAIADIESGTITYNLSDLGNPEGVFSSVLDEGDSVILAFNIVPGDNPDTVINQSKLYFGESESDGITYDFIKANLPKLKFYHYVKYAGSAEINEISGGISSESDSCLYITPYNTPDKEGGYLWGGGDYVVVLKAGESQDLKINYINQTKALTGSSVSWNASSDGTTGDFYVTKGETILIPGTDYDWSPRSVSEPGSYDFKVYGMGDFEGQTTGGSFTVYREGPSPGYDLKIGYIRQRKLMEGESVEWIASSDKESGDFYVSSGDTILRPDKDYEYWPRSVETLGEHEFNVYGIGDYSGKNVSGNFVTYRNGWQIKYINQVKYMSSNSVSWNACADGESGDFYVTDGEKYILKPGTDYDWNPKSVDDEGEYEFFVKGNGDYEKLSLSGNFSVISKGEEIPIVNNIYYGGDRWILSGRIFPWRKKNSSLFLGFIDGRRIRGRYSYPITGRMIPFRLYIAYEGGIIDKGRSLCEVTMRIPPGMDPKYGTIKLVGITDDDKEVTYDYEIVEEEGYECLRFKGEMPADIGIIYIPGDGLLSSKRNFGVIDERKNKRGTAVISGNICPAGGTNVFLLVEDSDGDDIKGVFPISANSTLTSYQLSIVDQDGNLYTDYTLAQVTLPLPAGVDPSKGTIEVVGVGSDGLPVVYNPEIVKIGNIYAVRIADYFPGEVGIIFTPKKGKGGGGSSGGDDDDDDDSGGGGGGGSSGGGSGGGGGGGQFPVVPTIANGSGAGAAGPGGYGAGGANGTYGSNGGYGSGGMGGYGSSGGSGGYYSNANDMPKTGTEDVVRILLVAMLFLFGCIEIISSVSVKRKVLVSTVDDEKNM